jgi:hypothetical protein
MQLFDICELEKKFTMTFFIGCGKIMWKLVVIRTMIGY